MLYMKIIKNQYWKIIMLKKKTSNNKGSTLKTKTYNSRPNNFNADGTFTTKRKWYDYGGIFFIFPTIMVEKNIDLNVDTLLLRRTIFAIGYHRWSFDKGKYNPLVKKKIVSKEELSHFVSWCKKKTNNKWSIQDVELVLSEDEGIKKMVNHVDLNNHYVKLILLKEMIELRIAHDITDDDTTILKREKIRVSKNKSSTEDFDISSELLDQFNDLTK